MTDFVLFCHSVCFVCLVWMLRNLDKHNLLLTKMTYKIDRRLSVSHEGNLLSLVIGKTGSKAFEQSQKEDCIAASKAIEALCDGVCLCLTQDSFNALRASIEPASGSLIYELCNVFCVEAIGERQAYYLVVNKGNDEFKRFVTGEAALNIRIKDF